MPRRPTNRRGLFVLVPVLIFLTYAVAQLSAHLGLIVALVGSALVVALYRPRVPEAKSLGGTIAVIVALVGVAAGFAYASVRALDRHEAAPHQDPPQQHLAPPVRKHARVPRISPRPPAPRSPSTWDDLCGADPGSGAPEFAATLLRRLYLGPQLPNQGPPPGAIAGGCTAAPFSPPGYENAVVYVKGYAGGTLKSLAVVSRRWGPAVFLAPAAMLVDKLVERYPDLGGWPRTDVGDGDYYGVMTAFGTAVLIRSSKTRDYLVLLPAAATVWLDAMRRCGCWLWPVAADVVNGKRRILLLRDTDARVAANVIFADSRTDSARLAHEKASRTRYGYMMQPADIETFARMAP